MHLPVLPTHRVAVTRPRLLGHGSEACPLRRGPRQLQTRLPLGLRPAGRSNRPTVGGDWRRNRQRCLRDLQQQWSQGQLGQWDATMKPDENYALKVNMFAPKRVPDPNPYA